jgi:hypothetical protein
MGFSQSLLGYKGCHKLTKTQEDSKSAKHNMWVSAFLGLNFRLGMTNIQNLSLAKIRDCVFIESGKLSDCIMYLFIHSENSFVGD